MPPEEPRPASPPPASPPPASPPPASPPPVTPPPSSPAGASPESKPANQLTPEEQMALYEKELKETDWGHQPC